MSKRYDVAHMSSAHAANDTRIALKMARSLAQSGRSVAFVVPHNANETVGGVDILAVPLASSRMKRMLVTTWQVLSRTINSGAKVCHFHDPELMPAGLALKLLGRKVIYDVHEDLPRQIETKTWIPAIIRIPVAALSEFAERVTAIVVDRVIAATPTIAKRFPSSKTVLIQNYPILGELRSDQRNEPEASRTLAYVGNITPERGGNEMSRALGLVKSRVKLEFAGVITPSSLRAEMQKEPGWQRFVEHGTLDRNGVRGMFGRACAGLVLFHPVPNHVNAQPNKLFEYMSAGLAVVASDFPLWREIIDGAGAGLLVDPLNPQAIAEAIEWILLNPRSVAEMGERGYQAVLSRYSWQSEERRLVALYDELLSTCAH